MNPIQITVLGLERLRDSCSIQYVGSLKQQLVGERRIIATESFNMQMGLNSLETAQNPPDLIILYACFANLGLSYAVIKFAKKHKIMYGLLTNIPKEKFGPDSLFECGFHFQTTVSTSEFQEKVLEVLGTQQRPHEEKANE